MDPYLERHWGDVHTSLIIYARDQLRTQLPKELRVRVEEHVTIESEDEQQRSGIYPDIRIIERPHQQSEAAAAVVDQVDINHQMEPIQVPIEEPATERSIRIYGSSSGDRLITAIEIISLTNKNIAAGRELYLRKQMDLREARVNLVEIDLLRGGHYILTAPPGRFPSETGAAYCACVTRAISPRWGSVYPILLRERLPVINIPLRIKDADARLDLQALIDQAYENGGYGDDLDYQLDPVPPLPDEDAAWADALLREQKRR